MARPVWVLVLGLLVAVVACVHAGELSDYSSDAVPEALRGATGKAEAGNDPFNEEGSESRDSVSESEAEPSSTALNDKSGGSDTSSPTSSPLLNDRSGEQYREQSAEPEDSGRWWENAKYWPLPTGPDLTTKGSSFRFLNLRNTLCKANGLTLLGKAGAAISGTTQSLLASKENKNTFFKHTDKMNVKKRTDQQDEICNSCMSTIVGLVTEGEMADWSDMQKNKYNPLSKARAVKEYRTLEAMKEVFHYSKYIWSKKKNKPVEDKEHSKGIAKMQCRAILDTYHPGKPSKLEVKTCRNFIRLVRFNGKEVLVNEPMTDGSMIMDSPTIEKQQVLYQSAKFYLNDFSSKFPEVDEKLNSRATDILDALRVQGTVPEYLVAKLETNEHKSLLRALVYAYDMCVCSSCCNAAHQCVYNQAAPRLASESSEDFIEISTAAVEKAFRTIQAKRVMIGGNGELPTNRIEDVRVDILTPEQRLLAEKEGRKREEFLRKQKEEEQAQLDKVKTNSRSLMEEAVLAREAMKRRREAKTAMDTVPEERI